MRPTRDQNMLEVARVISKRGTCNRRLVGAVIVDEHGFILSTGYNGVPRKVLHCSELHCSDNSVPGKNLDSCMALHAEQNAIAQLRNPMEAHTLYCTTEPCISCLKLILATGIQRVVFEDSYPGERKLLALTNISWEQIHVNE